MAQSMSAKYVLQLTCLQNKTIEKSTSKLTSWQQVCRKTRQSIFQQIYQAELGPDEGKIDCCKNITKTLPFEKCQNNGQLTNDGWANGQKHYFLRK